MEIYYDIKNPEFVGYYSDLKKLEKENVISILRKKLILKDINKFLKIIFKIRIADCKSHKD